MNKIKGQVRQGDVLLHPINIGILGKKLKSIPVGAKRIESKEAIVLAWGEVTGHKHQITDFDKVALIQEEYNYNYGRSRQVRD